MIRRPRGTDYTGQVFGKLTVLSPAKSMSRNAASLCRCECGVEKEILNVNLRSGATASCGCLRRANASARMKESPIRLSHGMKRKSGNTPEERLTYNSWSGMVSRCRDPQNPLYPKYGGKGITVSDRWADPKQGIHNFIEDMGLRPSRNHSIDRIAGGSYEPGQCRWATREQQNRNVGLKKSNTLGYKGVSLNRKRPGQFRAEIRCNQGHVYLGTYPSVEEAAFAYDLASKELHGEYGWVNGNVQLTREQEDNVRNKVKVFIQDSLVKGV